jgi:hypothetical protein
MYTALGEEGIKVSFTTYNVVHVSPEASEFQQPSITEGIE